MNWQNRIGVLVIHGFDFLKHRRRISSRREIVRFEGDKKNGRIRISGSFKITTLQKWCRIGLVFRFSETVKWYEYEPSIGLRFNNYRVSIADHMGKVLFSEKRSLMEFASLFKTAYAGQRFLGRYTATHKGEVAILEFIPPYPGRYELDFDLAADEDFSEPGHKRMTSFQELTLYVREGVEPLEGTDYPHKRIDLMKVRDIMTRPIIAEDEEVLVTIKPEVSIDEMCKLVAKTRIKRLPVVENGALMGIATTRELLTRKPECVREFYF